MSTRPLRYLHCSHNPCTQRYFFGAEFLEIVRFERGREGWIFWRCNNCRQISSARVTALDICYLNRGQPSAPIRDIYSDEFKANIMELRARRFFGSEISELEADELTWLFNTPACDHAARELHRQMPEVHLG